MSKLAALYGDSATLVSLKAKSFEVINRSIQGSFFDWDTKKIRSIAGGKEMADMMDCIDAAAIDYKDKMRQLENIESKTSRAMLRSDKSYIALKKRIRNPELISSQLRAQMREQSAKFGYNELERLVSGGFLDISTDDELSVGGDMAEAFIKRIFSIFDTQTLTYPLFDDDVANLVKLGIKDGLISPSQSEILRAKQITLPADFLSRLPNFSQASSKEVLDIRRALDKHLTRFRSVIIEYSEEIKSASWDKDFKFDVEIMYTRKVAPAILEIEEAIEENRISRQIFNNVLTKGAASGVFSFVVSNVDSFTDILGKTGASILGMSIGAAATIANDFQSQRAKTSKNGVYFLYEVKKRLRK